MGKYIDFIINYNDDPKIMGQQILQHITVNRLKANKPCIIFIGGDSGEGKCLDGNTEILLENGELKKVSEIAKDSNKVVALDKDLRLTKADKTDFYSREVNQLLEITLRTGKTLKLTPEHPLLQIDGWKQASKLSIGDRIAVPRKINVFGMEPIEECKVKILAYLIAEGTLTRSSLMFANTDVKIIQDFKNSVYDFADKLMIRESGKYNFRISKSYHSHEKTPIFLWIEKLGLNGKTSLDKFIPNCVFTLPKNQLALFLNRLFSCDGTIYRRGSTWDISYSSSSEKMIHQVQHLLLRFGIVAILKYRKTKCNPNWELMIRGRNIITYLQEIGFYGRKESRVPTALFGMLSKKLNPNIDTIPKKIWDLYRPKCWADVGRKIGLKTPKSLCHTINYNPSRNQLKRIAIHDNNIDILNLAESDIYWDEIVDIKSLSGKFVVYDISVPRYHNFIANDIIVHNSSFGLKIVDAVNVEYGIDTYDTLNDSVVYLPVEYLTKLDNCLHWKKYNRKDLKNLHVIMIDEAREVVRARDWYTFINRAIADCNAMSRRIKPLVLIVISQFIKDIDSAIRYTLSFYAECQRPLTGRTRVTIERVWKNTYDLERPRLCKRPLVGYVKEGNTMSKFYPRFQANMPDRKIWNKYDEENFNAKSKILRKRIEETINKMQKQINIFDKVAALVDFYMKNPDQLTTIIDPRYKKFRLRKQFKEMHEITRIEQIEFEKRLQEKLQEKGMLATD